jgi:hypothetical protein
MITALLRNDEAKRVFVAIGLLVLVMLGGLRLVSSEGAMDILTSAGYWCELATAILFVWALTRTLPDFWRSVVWNRTDAYALAGVAGMGAVLLAHEAAGFKILMDEIQLLGTSMAMHFDRSVFVPQRAHDLQGVFELMGGMLDKRPLFFPFLVSVVHDATGYRPENVFYLNALLTFALLGLSYCVGRALGGWRAGVLAALWWMTLPLLSQNARGGGFELLNLVMVMLTGLLAGWHYHRRDGGSMIALVYSGILLAQTRYESPLFLVPVAAVIILVWWEGRAIRIPWAVVVSPLFLFPVFLLVRIFEARPQSWEMASKPGTTAAFSMANISDNFAHALAFWFNFGVEQPNSPLLAAVGLLAVICCLVRLRRWIGNWRAEPASVRVGLLFAGALLAHLILMLCYFWGKFDEPVIRRLSLPTHLLFIFAPVLALRDLRISPCVFSFLLAGAGLSFLVSGAPGLARQAATRLYYPALETAWRREFMKVFPAKDFLVIDNDTSLWITHLVSATPVIRARDHPDMIAFNLQNRMFSSIFVFQRFDIDQQTGALTVKRDDELGDAYVLETVAERSFRIDLLSRLSRVKAVRNKEGSRVETAPIASAIDFKSSERDAREKALLEQWLKNLP